MYGNHIRFTQWSIGHSKIQNCFYNQNGFTNSSEIWNWTILSDDLSNEVEILKSDHAPLNGGKEA